MDNYRDIIFWAAIGLVIYFLINYYSNVKIVNDTPAPQYGGDGNGGSKLYLFYANWCGHCTTYRLGKAGSHESAYPPGSPPKTSEWGKTFYYFNETNPDLNVKAIEINADNGHPLTEKYNVKGFPTVVLSTDKGAVYTYDGSRTNDALVQFVTSKLSYS